MEQAEGLAICVTRQGLAFRRIAALEAMTAIVGREVQVLHVRGHVMMFEFILPTLN